MLHTEFTCDVRSHGGFAGSYTFSPQHYVAAAFILQRFPSNIQSFARLAAIATWVYADALFGCHRRLQSMGYPTEYQTFDMSGARDIRSQNVVATLNGQTRPNEVVIVGAHYDSLSEMSSQSAPGADDNGSGTANMLEVRLSFCEWSQNKKK